MAKEKLTAADAHKRICDTISAAHISGAPSALADSCSFWSILHVSFSRAWTVEASIEITIGDPVSCRVSWPSTYRTPSQSIAAIALYREVAELACLIEAQFDGIEITAK